MDSTLTKSLDGFRRLDPRRRVRFLTQVFPEAARPRPLVDRIVAGRRPPTGQLKLADALTSRSHFELSVVKGAVEAVRLRDLDSKNGTWLEGKRVESEYLRDDKVIRAGDSLLVFSENDAPPGEPPDPKVGVSPALTFVEHRADQLARADLPVLVVGPSGAGKERIAQRLHAESGRRGQLVSVNCAAFHGELLASELFGHVAGAFSGARGAREGLFVSAKGGTLFLDEIAEMPLGQQAALLRVLQERRVRPVGSDREISVDIRVVCATHQDLRERVEAGAFRGDLYARLAGARIEIPALARRKVDVLPLFRHFLGRIPIDADAAEALLLYEWPYNVRELQHAAGAARIDAAPLGKVDLAVLPPDIQEAYLAKTTAQEDAVPVERDGLEALLREHRGNVSAVADAAGLTRQQLYRRMRSFALDPKAFR